MAVLLLRRLPFVLFFFILAPLSAQDTISVDAVSLMPICGKQAPDPSVPCATPPRAVRNDNPIYPEKARKARTEGTVILDLIVAKDGTPHDVHALQGPSDELNQAAIKAVSQWKFSPATYQGESVEVEIKVEVNFRLQSTSAASPTQPATGIQGQVNNLYTDASEAYSRDDYQTAADLARRITAMAPQYRNVWNLLGLSLLALRQFDGAAEAFQKEIDVNPTSSNAYNNLGRVYWRQRKYEDAAVQFRRQLVINPQDHYAHNNLGMMLRDEKKCSEAVPELEKGIAITPNKPDALLALGECHIDLGDLAKGLSEMEQATSSSSAPNTWNSAAYSLDQTQY
jgi:TonB family protein